MSNLRIRLSGASVQGRVGSNSSLKGSISTGGQSTYILPIASETILGGIKIGDNLVINEDGVLSAVAGGTGANNYNALTNRPLINGVLLEGNFHISYNDLEDTPTNVSEFNNDAGYIDDEDLEPYATKEWVNDQGFISESGLLENYATKQWVTDKNYVTSASLTAYATKEWVNNKNYVTSSTLTNYATKQWVDDKNYITSADLSNYATKEELNIKANTADLANVAFSGSYNDLTDKPISPEIPTNISYFVNDVGYLTEHQDISGKQDVIDSSHKLSASLVSGLSSVATSGSYNDLSNRPTIPTVNNGVLTIKRNSTSIGTFSANSSSNVSVDISVPTNTNQLTNGAGFQTATEVNNSIASKFSFDVTTGRLDIII